ncbi:MAG TPA: AAA family ATPase [Rubricoccaceae bacterium]|jgi:SpoVK/Ycf46/Vps4 family AAA+-type ATPase
MDQTPAPTAAALAAPTADPLAHYPTWARELARRYFTKTINQFILHGNVRDLVAAETDGDGGTPGRAYVPLRQFLSEDLFAGRDLVVFYDRSDGIHFLDAESRRDFARAVSGYDSLFGTDFAKRMPKDPPRVFALLDNYFRLRLADGKRVACVIDYAETVVPMSEAASYSTEDRAALVTLQKWAHDPTLLRADFTLVLIAENLNDLSRPFIQSPYNAELEITLPGQEQRTAFIEWFLSDGGPSGAGARARYAALSDVPDLALAQNTAGLGYVQLRSILADVLENQRRLTFETLSDKKKELIEAEAYGLLEFVESPFGLDSVAGHGEAKAHLRAAAEAIKTGRPDVMPMGYLVNGPVGTGKTFLITSFAGEIGIPMVMLKNFRSQWQGVTEGNLEKILTLLRAMNPVAVMIDEADAALGDRSASGDSGVSSRVFGQIAQAMSDTRFRGKIIWFLVTARPDLMPVDLKRQGRAEEHLALFYPSTREDREELLRVMMKKTGVDVAADQIPEVLLDGARTYSGADMEALLTRAKFRAATDARMLAPVADAGASAPAEASTEAAPMAEASHAATAPSPGMEPASAGAESEGPTLAQPTASGDAAAEAPASAAPGTVTRAILESVVHDFLPPTYPLQVELQNLVAVMECTSRSMLPERFRSLDREATVRRVEELKRLIGER